MRCDCCYDDLWWSVFSLPEGFSSCCAKSVRAASCAGETTAVCGCAVS